MPPQSPTRFCIIFKKIHIFHCKYNCIFINLDFCIQDIIFTHNRNGIRIKIKAGKCCIIFILSKLFFTIKLYSTNGIRLFTSVRCFSSSCASQSAPSLTSSLYLVKRYSFNFVLFFASNKYWCFFAFSINAASLCASFPLQNTRCQGCHYTPLSLYQVLPYFHHYIFLRAY